MAYGTRIHKGSPIISILSWINPILVLIHISLKSILILSSHQRLDLPKGIFPVGVPVKILKELLPSSILATRPAHFNLLYLITLAILSERYKLHKVPHCGALSTRHSHPSWLQIFASGSGFQITLGCVPPLMLETIIIIHMAQLAILFFYIF